MFCKGINDSFCPRKLKVPCERNSFASMKIKIFFLKGGFYFETMTCGIFHQLLDLGFFVFYKQGNI